MWRVLLKHFVFICCLVLMQNRKKRNECSNKSLFFCLAFYLLRHICGLWHWNTRVNFLSGQSTFHTISFPSFLWRYIFLFNLYEKWLEKAIRFTVNVVQVRVNAIFCFHNSVRYSQWYDYYFKEKMFILFF